MSATIDQHKLFRELTLKALEKQNDPTIGPKLLLSIIVSLQKLNAPPSTILLLRSIHAVLSQGGHIRAHTTTVHDIKKYQQLTEHLKTDHERNTQKLTKLPLHIKNAMIKCQHLIHQRNNVDISISCLFDDILLMNAEKVEGKLEEACTSLQSKISDAHLRIEKLKQTINILRSDSNNMKRNHKMFSKERLKHESSQVKKTSLIRAMEPAIILKDEHKRLLKQHVKMQRNYIKKSEASHHAMVQLKLHRKSIQKTKNKIQIIKNTCDKTPNWRHVVERIGKYDLTTCLKLGIHDETSLISRQRINSTKSTSDNVNEIYQMYKQCLRDTGTKKESSSKSSTMTTIFQMPHIETVETARLQILFKEYDVLFSILQQRIRELPYHYHVVDKAIDVWSHQTFKRFDGLGDNSDVPLWLRSQVGALFDRRMEEWNHNRVREVIDDIWGKYLEVERRASVVSGTSPHKMKKNEKINYISPK